MLIAYSGGKKFKDKDVSFFVMFLRHKINDIHKHKNIHVAVQIFRCPNVIHTGHTITLLIQSAYSLLL